MIRLQIYAAALLSSIRLLLLVLTTVTPADAQASSQASRAIGDNVRSVGIAIVPFDSTGAGPLSLTETAHTSVVTWLLALLGITGCLTRVNLLRPQYYLEYHIKTKMQAHYLSVCNLFPVSITYGWAFVPGLFLGADLDVVPTYGKLCLILRHKAEH